MALAVHFSLVLFFNWFGRRAWPGNLFGMQQVTEMISVCRAIRLIYFFCASTPFVERSFTAPLSAFVESGE